MWENIRGISSLFFCVPTEVRIVVFKKFTSSIEQNQLLAVIFLFVL